jgi:SAM-dependent methyltransferase
MARLTILAHPALPTHLDLRLWAMAGHSGQPFRLGNFYHPDASVIAWLEIIHIMMGQRVFYFRHFVQIDCAEEFRAQINKFGQGECTEVEVRAQGSLAGFSVRRVSAEPAEDLASETSWGTSANQSLPDHFELELRLPELGFPLASFLQGPEGLEEGQAARPLEFIHTTYSEESIWRFLHEIADEMEQAIAGKWLDPRAFDAQTSRWPLAERLNVLAYDFLASEFQENYFKRQRVEKAFQQWLSEIPPGGAVLDVGCGHGNPVIGILLQAGHKVTGIDLSPQMLERARRQYPMAGFIEGNLLDSPMRTTYAAACSFNALLYLDPIDLSFTLLYLAMLLKPGALLCVYSYFDHPHWTGEPVDHGMGVPMWSWDYDLSAACAALQTHGLFEVVRSYPFRARNNGSGPYLLVARRNP